MDLVAGIDIGGTMTKIGLVEHNGKCHEQLFFRTRDFDNFDSFLDRIVEGIDELKANFKTDVNLIGCGIGAPNASSRSGTIENAANLKWKGTVPILAKMNAVQSPPVAAVWKSSA